VRLEDLGRGERQGVEKKPSSEARVG